MLNKKQIYSDKTREYQNALMCEENKDFPNIKKIKELEQLVDKYHKLELEENKRIQNDRKKTK